MVLRAGDGALYAVLGSERLRVPDLQTATVFGFAPADVVPAAPETLASSQKARPAGPPGRGWCGPPAARWCSASLAGAGCATGSCRRRGPEVHGPALNSVPPVLLDGMVVEGHARDVFLVEGAHLRKVPDWVWLLMRGHKPEEAVRVPERILVTLPQNSPQWRIPGGPTWTAPSSPPSWGARCPTGCSCPQLRRRAGGGALLLPGGLSAARHGGRFDEWRVAWRRWPTSSSPTATSRKPSSSSQGGLGYWMNQDGPGATPWAEYVARDLVRYVDATYRTVARREARAGVSMGGHGAVRWPSAIPTCSAWRGAQPLHPGRDSARRTRV